MELIYTFAARRVLSNGLLFGLAGNPLEGRQHVQNAAVRLLYRHRRSAVSLHINETVWTCSFGRSVSQRAHCNTTAALWSAHRTCNPEFCSDYLVDLLFGRPKFVFSVILVNRQSSKGFKSCYVPVYLFLIFGVPLQRDHHLTLV